MSCKISSRNLVDKLEALRVFGLDKNTPVRYFKCNSCGEEYPRIEAGSGVESLPHLSSNILYLTYRCEGDYLLTTPNGMKATSEVEFEVQRLLGCERRVQREYHDFGIRALKPAFRVENHGREEVYYYCPSCHGASPISGYTENLVEFLTLGGIIQIDDEQKLKVPLPQAA